MSGPPLVLPPMCLFGQSGSVVHLQLVQVLPGLCEIGSNHEENQTLIQDQQKLMEKLQVREDGRGSG